MMHVNEQDYWSEEIAEVRDAVCDLVACPNQVNLDHLAMEVFDAMGAALLVCDHTITLIRARYAITNLAGDAIFSYILRNPNLFWEWLAIKEAKGYPSSVPWKQTLRRYMIGI